MDLFADLGHGVRRAGGHAGVRGIEHFGVVVAVADGETAGCVEAVEARDLGETAAFLEIAVAEAQVDRVSLPREVWLGGDDGRDVIDDPRHFLFSFGDDTGGFALHFEPLGAGVFFDFAADVGEHFSAAFEEFVHMLVAVLVPRRVGQPTAEVVGKEDFALARDHPIGEKWETAFGEALHHVCHGSSGVDSPDDVLRFAQPVNQREERGRNGRLIGGMVQCAVEIK